MRCDEASLPSLQCAQLEQRILMSASPAPAAAAGEPLDAVETVRDDVGPLVISNADVRVITSVNSDTPENHSSVTREIVLVDPSVEDYQTLVDDILNNADSGRAFEVFTFDSQRDGVEQITELL
jgi:hypothetical protein